MPRRFAVVMLALLASAAWLRAQDAPEKLLPATTQLFLRWDGIESHKAEYEKLALGKMMAGDTGKFLGNVYDQFQDLLGGAIVQELLQGTPPEKLQKIQADALDAPKFLKVLGDNGFLLGVELIGLEPPNVQVTLVFPNAGEKAAPLFAALRLGAALGKAEIKEAKVDDRTVYSFKDIPIPHGWWVEGKHVVMTAGTLLPTNVISKMTKGPSILDNPLYKKVEGFKEFKTGARAFVDVAALVKIAGTRGKEVSQILTDLGVDGIKSLAFYSGFDGAAEHGLMELEMTGQPKGVLKMLGGKPFKLADLPPLPDDVTTWTMTNFDTKVAFDEGVSAARAVLKLVSPDEAPQFEEFLKEANEGLGVNLRKDLLEHLGDKMVQYTSTAEGPLFFGQVILVQVKDEAKLKEGLDNLLKGLGKKVGAEVTQKKRTYHGVEMSEIHVRQQGFIFVPSYVVHKGWLALSFYPQGVQGFILRSNGELPVWKATDPAVKDALDKLPKEFLSVSVSDPRPGVKQLLSLAPLIGGAVNSFVPESKFDVGTIPNAYEATKHLFPNVSVTSMKGDTLRMESRSSLELPLEMGNTDSVVALQLLSLVIFRGVK